MSVGDRRMIAGLAVTQTIGYGALYYAFAVIVTPLAAELRTSRSVATGALTLAVLVAAAAAVPVGRWLDRHSGRGLMSFGSLLGTAGLVAWSQVQTVAQLYLVFVVIGLACAMVLYEAAFTVIVHQVVPARRAKALLAVTLVAGFASSIFLPITGLLVDRLGWRGALLVLAAGHGLLTIVLHLTTVPAGRPQPAPARHQHARSRQRLVLGDRGFWLLALTFVAQGAAVSVAGVHLVGYLITLGHAAVVAATIAGLLGLLSVTGRVITTGLTRRWAITRVVAAAFVVQGLAALALPAAGRTLGGAVACVVAFGLGFGVGSIARPAILADRYGTADYGAISGLLAVPVTVAKAFAPLVAAGLAGTVMMLSVGSGCLIASIALTAMRRVPAPGSTPSSKVDERVMELRPIV